LGRKTEVVGRNRWNLIDLEQENWEKNEKRTRIEGVGIEGCVVMNTRYAYDSYMLSGC